MKPEWLSKRLAAYDAWQAEYDEIYQQSGYNFINAVYDHQIDITAKLVKELASRTPSNMIECAVWLKTITTFSTWLQNADLGECLTALTQRLTISEEANIDNPSGTGRISLPSCA